MTDAPASYPLTAPLTEAAPSKPEGVKARRWRYIGAEQPDFLVHGWLLAEEETGARDGRRAVLQLLETGSGTFVATRGNCSDIEGELNYWTGCEVATVEDAMAAWGNNQLAKIFARKLGWKPVRRFT